MVSDREVGSWSPVVPQVRRDTFRIDKGDLDAHDVANVEEINKLATNCYGCSSAGVMSSAG